MFKYYNLRYKYNIINLFLIFFRFFFLHADIMFGGKNAPK
jgi:hypothetical protein